MQKNCYILLILILFNFVACQNNSGINQSRDNDNKFEDLQITDESQLIRDFAYDPPTILRNHRDPLAFRNSYSYAEIMDFYENSDYLKQESNRGIFVDDDLVYYSIFDILHSSTDLILGQVIQVKSQWGTGDDSDMIFTCTTIQVFKSLKGVIEPQVIKVIDLGGQIGELITDMSNWPYPKYRENELVFVALWKNSEGLETFGRSQGKFSVIVDQKR